MVMQIIVELLFLNINENDVVSIASTIYECNLTKAERAANCRMPVMLAEDDAEKWVRVENNVCDFPRVALIYELSAH